MKLWSYGKQDTFIAHLENTEKEWPEMVKHFGKEVPPHSYVWSEVRHSEAASVRSIVSREIDSHCAERLLKPSLSSETT